MCSENKTNSWITMSKRPDVAFGLYLFCTAWNMIWDLKKGGGGYRLWHTVMAAVTVWDRSIIKTKYTVSCSVRNRTQCFDGHSSAAHGCCVMFFSTLKHVSEIFFGYFPCIFHPFFKTERAKESLKTRWGVTLTKGVSSNKKNRTLMDVPMHTQHTHSFDWTISCHLVFPELTAAPGEFWGARGGKKTRAAYFACHFPSNVFTASVLRCLGSLRSTMITHGRWVLHPICQNNRKDDCDTGGCQFEKNIWKCSGGTEQQDELCFLFINIWPSAVNQNMKPHPEKKRRGVL